MQETKLLIPFKIVIKNMSVYVYLYPTVATDVASTRLCLTVMNVSIVNV